MATATLRQQEIVKAARTIIFNKGVEGLTIRKIADTLKITDGALYRHFRSKNEIVSLIIDDIEATLTAVITRAANTDFDPISKLQNIFLAHLIYAKKNNGVTFILLASLNDKKSQNKMLLIINQYLKLIKQILKQGIAENTIRPDLCTEESSIAFFSLIQGMVTLWRLNPKHFNLSKTQIEKLFIVYKNSIIPQ